MLDYERLDVYRCAIDHLAFVFKAIPRLPRGYSALRNNRYAIARGEAMECGAIIDVVRLLDSLPDVELVAARQLLFRMVGMLSKLCR